MRTFHLGIVIVIVLCFPCVFYYSDDVESTQLNKKSKLIPSLLNHLNSSNMENDLDSSCDDVTNTVDDYDFYIRPSKSWFGVRTWSSATLNPRR